MARLAEQRGCLSIWILLGLTSLAVFNTLPLILDPLETEAGESRVVWQGGPFGSVNLSLKSTFGRNILYNIFWVKPNIIFNILFGELFGF